VLGRVFPPARPALLTFAGAICACRPYLGMHYPSDVIAGMTLGAFIGKAYPLPAERKTGPSSPDEFTTSRPGGRPPGETGRAAEDLPGGISSGREAEHSPGGVSP
jgi:hypothetical protein